MTSDEFAKIMFFIQKLENLEEHGQGCGYDYGYLFRDDFELLKKVVRSAYYGGK